MLNWVLGNKRKDKTASPKKKKATGKKPSYDKSREIASKGSITERQNLAQHEDLEPEILYYFASDSAAEVRREVAENFGTPLQADLVLARDVDEEVRCELATKIGRLVPQLSPDESERLTDMAVEVLEVLARDELPRVRAIIAEELKHADNVPKPVIERLASDLEEIVSVPVLEYSPLLNASDLVNLVTGGLGENALAAVARRPKLPAAVVDAVVDTDNERAVASVVENSTAEISDTTFETIADQAEEHPALQEPLVYRDLLPKITVMRIASFISAALMETLIERNAKEKDVVEQLRKTVRDRIERGELEVQEPDDRELASDRARRMFEEGALNDEAIDEALDANDLVFVRHGLALLAGTDEGNVTNLVRANSAKAITALAFKAELKMRTAVRLQTQRSRMAASRWPRRTSIGISKAFSTGLSRKARYAASVKFTAPKTNNHKAYPSEPGLTTCWVCGCHRQDVRLMFCHAQPLERRPPDVPRRLRGALSR